MNFSAISSPFRIALVSSALALTAGLFAVGCGAEAPGTGEGVDQTTQAATAPTTTAAPVEVRTYPPHGYPCLGCHPCGTSYCDDHTNKIVCAGNGQPVVTEAPKSE